MEDSVGAVDSGHEQQLERSLAGRLTSALTGIWFTCPVTRLTRSLHGVALAQLAQGVRHCPCRLTHLPHRERVPWDSLIAHHAKSVFGFIVSLSCRLPSRIDDRYPITKRDDAWRTARGILTQSLFGYANCWCNYVDSYRYCRSIFFCSKGRLGVVYRHRNHILFGPFGRSFYRRRSSGKDEEE